MTIEVKSWLTGSVLFAYEAEDNSIRITLEAAVKAHAYLSGANLRSANLSGANLRDAYLSGADLSDADLSDANLSGANLRGADLRGAYLRDAYLSGADLSGAYLSGADLSGANLRDADLSDAYLRDAYLSGAYLSGANLRDADLSGADLSGANLSGADLSGANLRDAYLSGADLSDANLPQATDEEISRLDAVREIVMTNQERLDMSLWHGERWNYTHTPEEERTCGTPHCIAGWLQALSPDESVRKLDPELAGWQLAPSAGWIFTASRDRALRWLRDREYAAHKDSSKV